MTPEDRAVVDLIATKLMGWRPTLNGGWFGPERVFLEDFDPFINATHSKMVRDKFASFGFVWEMWSHKCTPECEVQANHDTTGVVVWLFHPESGTDVEVAGPDELRAVCECAAKVLAAPANDAVMRRGRKE